jgi:hypothetical protein
MSKLLPKQPAQKPADKGIRSKTADAEAPVIEQAPLIEKPGRHSQPSALADRSTAEEEDDD